MKNFQNDTFTFNDLGLKPEDIIKAEFVEAEDGEYDFQCQVSEEAHAILTAFGERLNINPTELIFQMALSDTGQVTIKNGEIQKKNLEQNGIKKLMDSIQSRFLKKDDEKNETR